MPAIGITCIISLKLALVVPHEKKVCNCDHNINHDVSQTDEELYICVNLIYSSRQKGLLFIWKGCNELIFPHPFLSCFVEAIT